MAAKIFRINYKSDFILNLTSDAGWMTPFCIKFWTGAPSQAYYVGWDGETYTHCAYDPSEPTKLQVQFDDHQLPIGDLKFQVAYHFTVADFPNDTEDEVLNQAKITTEVDGVAYDSVMLDFTGETAPEIEFSLPAYANEAQRIANEQQRIANEQQRISNEETRISHEQTRQNNESQRIQREQTRQNNEAQRIQREQARQSNEEQRIQREQARQSNEEQRIQREQTRQEHEAQRISNEQARVQEFSQIKSAATSATNAANSAANNANDKAQYAKNQGDYAKEQGQYAKEQGDYAKEQGDTALADHRRAEADHSTAVDDHTQASNDHTRAESDHTTASNDHTTAQSDHTTAGNDHTRAESDHTRAESDHAAVEVYVDSLGVFDLSKHNAVGGVLATYADLSAALTALNALDSKYKYGGMSFKFVQSSVSSSDNKYVQARCMADSFTTDITQWQEVDDKPTADSNNIIKSGGVFTPVNALEHSLIPINGKVSIIGDSISTYIGTMPSGYIPYYPNSPLGVTSLYDMWWHLILSATKSELEVNASWSGSRVTDGRSGDGYPDFYDRTNILGTPDYIFVALGTNDSSNNVTLGNYDYDSEILNLSEAEFIPAYIKGVKALINNYPNAKIVLFVFKMNSRYSEVIKNIGKHYNLPVIDVQSYYTNNDHPSKNGMMTVAQDVFSFYLKGKVDDVPTAGSNNLVKSGGIYNQIASLNVSNNQDLNKILLELYLESEQFGNETNATITFMKAHLYNGRYYNGINVFSVGGQQYNYEEIFSSETEALSNLKSLFIIKGAYFLINWQLINSDAATFQYLSFNHPYSLENNPIIYSSIQLTQYKAQNEERFVYLEQIKPIKKVNNGYMTSNGLITETGFGCDYYLAEQIPSGSTFISRVTGGQMYTIFYFDIDFNYLSGGYVYYTTPQTIEGTITKPQNTEYIVINRGSAETTSVTTNTIITNIEESIKNTKPVNNSQSIIVNLGDSLFAMGREEGTSISDFIKERIGGKIYNCALGGDTMSRWYDSWRPTPAGWSEFALVTLIDSIVSGDYSLQEQTLEDHPSTFPSYFSDVLNTLKQIDFSLVNIITISLGTNDYGCDVGIYYPSKPTSKSYFKSSYKYVLDTLFNAFPNIRVVLCTPLVRGDRTAPNGNNAVLSDFADCVKDLGKEYNSLVCDFYYEMGVNQHNLNSFLSRDLVHPQVYGREKMANKLSQKLQEF